MNGDIATGKIAEDAGGQHAPRFGGSLKTRRNIDTITEDIITLDHNVTCMQASAQIDRIGVMVGCIWPPYLPLNLDGATERLISRWKFDQRAIAHQLHHTSVRSGHGGIYDRSIDRVQSGEHTRSICLHHAAVADDIKHQNR